MGAQLQELADSGSSSCCGGGGRKPKGLLSIFSPALGTAQQLLHSSRMLLQLAQGRLWQPWHYSVAARQAVCTL